MNGETIRNRILRMPIDFATGREKLLMVVMLEENLYLIFILENTEE